MRRARLFVPLLLPGLALGILLVLATATQAPTWAGINIGADEHRKIWNMAFVGQIGGRSWHVAARAPYVYVSIGPRVVVVDVSDPQAPAIVDQTAMFPDQITDIFLAGRYMYVTWSYVNYGGLRVYDISEPASPALVADHFMPDHPAVGIYVLDNYAYLLAGADTDLRILDVSDPTAPVEMAVYWPAGWPNDIDVAGGYAYIAGDYAGLRVIDVSDPYAPVEVGWWVPPDRFRNRLGSVRVAGHIVYVSDGNDLWVLDVSEPAQPRQIGELEGTGGKIHRAGDLLFLSGWGEGRGRGVFIVDIADPTTPSVIGAYATPAYAHDVDTSGDYAFVAGGPRNGFQIIDITDPTMPVEAGAYEVPDAANDVKVTDHYAYVTSNGLHIIDISDPSEPVEVGFYHIPTEVSGENIGALGVDVLGQYAYVAIGYMENGDSGLRVIDISDPREPVEVSAYNTQAWARDVSVSRARGTDSQPIYAYVVTRHYPTSSLRVVDVSDPAAPAEIGVYEWEGSGSSVQVVGSYAYVAGSGLRIIDISNPAAPVEVGRAGSYSNDVFVRQDPTAETVLAYVVEAGFKIIDVSDPTSPTVVGATPPMQVDRIYVAGNYAYLTSHYLRGVRVFDVSNPAAPVEIGAHRTRGYARDVYVAGGYAYVTESQEALRIFRLVPTASASIPSGGGTLDSPTDGTRYTFPAGTFPDTVTVNHVVPAPDDIPHTAPFVNIGHVFVVSGVYNTTGQPAHPSRPYTITVQYADGVPAFEETLALYAWDGTQWVREPTSVVDPAGNTVTATPAHFGTWAVLGKAERMYLPVIFRNCHCWR